MLTNDDAGMLEEKGSRNEQVLAACRAAAATVPAPQAKAKQEANAK